MKSLISILIASLLAFVLSSFFCNSKRNKARTELHTRDSVYLTKTIKKMFKNKISPFNKNEFDSSTELPFFEILYSPDSLKLVLLVITKNSDSKLLSSGDPFGYHFNANYLFATRNTLNDHIRIFTYSSWELVHFSSFDRIKSRLFRECFEDRNKDIWTEDSHKFNMDNYRFWTSPEFNDITSDSSYITLEGENPNSIR